MAVTSMSKYNDDTCEDTKEQSKKAHSLRMSLKLKLACVDDISLFICSWCASARVGYMGDVNCPVQE